MNHHLSRLLLPAASAPSAAAFSTSSKKTYARRAKPVAASTGGDASAASPEAEVAEAKAAWQREKLPGELPRPPTIPFQPKVANTVRLVGTVGAPVHLQRTADGRFSVVSVLVQDRRVDFPRFWCDDLSLADFLYRLLVICCYS